jgi:hypothetical protein
MEVYRGVPTPEVAAVVGRDVVDRPRVHVHVLILVLANPDILDDDQRLVLQCTI